MFGLPLAIASIAYIRWFATIFQQPQEIVFVDVYRYVQVQQSHYQMKQAKGPTNGYMAEGKVGFTHAKMHVCIHTYVHAHEHKWG